MTNSVLLPKWKILCFGQLISFLYAIGGSIQSSMQLSCNWSAPAFSSSLMYFLCSLLLIPLYLECRKSNNKNCSTDYHTKFLGIIPIQGSPWAYLLMGLLDLEASYFTVLALKYTTLTSATILGSLATPATMIFSRLLLARRYTWVHVLGVAVCMAGTGWNIVQDFESSSSHADESLPLDVYNHKLTGDLFAVMGGIALGLNDAACELAVRNFGGDMEYLGMSGFFAAIIALAQSAVLEREQVVALFFDTTATAHDDTATTCPVQARIGLLSCFVAAQFLAYLLSTRFLQLSESALLNLSTLTENGWTVLFSIFVQRIFPDPLFYAGLVFTVTGVVIYETAPSPVLDDDTIDVIPISSSCGGEVNKIQEDEDDATEICTELEEDEDDGDELFEDVEEGTATNHQSRDSMMIQTQTDCEYRRIPAALAEDRIVPP